MVHTNTDSTKVLLFSGAGLSAPLGLPTTNGFKDIISSGNSGLLDFLKYHLGTNYDEDIEAILSSVEELNSTNNLIYKYIVKGSGKIHLSETKRYIDALRSESISYTNNLKKFVHRLLGTPDLTKCESLYSNIFKEIRTVIPNAAISFFTANYDITFEDSIGQNEKLKKDLQINSIDDGFSYLGVGLIFEPTRKYHWEPSILEYKKIHGSLGWTYDSRGRTTKSLASNTPDDPDSVPILYPGFKGYPDKEPFLSLHRQFLERLIDAKYVIFMGFAFRDIYINSLIDMAMTFNPDLKIFCYNPSEIDKLPPESHIHQLIMNKERFKYIKNKIEIIDNPLKLASNLKK